MITIVPPTTPTVNPVQTQCMGGLWCALNRVQPHLGLALEDGPEARRSFWEFHHQWGLRLTLMVTETATKERKTAISSFL